MKHNIEAKDCSQTLWLCPRRDDAAAVIGDEVGFTWEVYAPTGLTLKRKSEIVNAIAYPGLTPP